MQSRTAAIVSAAALGVATLGTAALGAAALAPSAVAAPARTTTVQVPERLCPRPAPGHVTCAGIRLATKKVSLARAAEMRRLGLAAPATEPDLTSGPAGGYTPAQLAKAYGVNRFAATSQTVAIVDVFNAPTLRQDTNTFDKRYGLPAETSTSLKIVNQSGGTNLPKPDAGWAGETSLDVQAVRAMCAKCKILVVLGWSDATSNLNKAVIYAAKHASIVTNSYGMPESDGITSADRAAYNHPGVAILASTGDDGWGAWDWFNLEDDPDGTPEFPSTANTVVAVGGTTLDLNPDGTRASERVWNSDGPNDDAGYAEAQTYGGVAGAAGSGCSTVINAQPWQRAVAGYPSLGCGSGRSGVDIAADADPYTGFDVCDSYEVDGSCWDRTGGTSLASPLVAGMWAVAGGPAHVSYPALTLYGHFNAGASRPFVDITSGGTGACDATAPTACARSFGSLTYTGSDGDDYRLDCAFSLSGKVLASRYQCRAKPGYDGVSGVGAPKGTRVFKAVLPTAVLEVNGPVARATSHKFSAGKSRSAFPGGTITKYVWTWGDGTSTTTKKPNAWHKYAAAGSYSVKLVVTGTYSAQNYHRTGAQTAKITVK